MDIEALIEALDDYNTRLKVEDESGKKLVRVEGGSDADGMPIVILVFE